MSIYLTFCLQKNKTMRTKKDVDNYFMLQKELFKILKRLVLFLILFFLVFIMVNNVAKILRFIFKVDNIMKILKHDDKISAMNSELGEPQKYYNSMNEYVSRTAKELGYINDLYTLNGTEWGEGINLLLVGSDKKIYNDEKARSDVIIVLRFNSNGKILSISIPRDTLVKLRDGKWTGTMDKIGHSFYWEGLDNLKNTVEDLLGSPVYRVAIIDNFRSFEAFLAIIGGIEVDAILYGQYGVRWIRDRNFKDGDIERCRRQQLFMKKAIAKMWQKTKNGNYIYSKFMYDVLKIIVYTDLTKNDFIKILYNLRIHNFLPEKDFLIGVLPGKFAKYDSVLLRRKQLDCWVLDDNLMAKMQFLFYSENDYQNKFLASKISFWNFFKLNLESWLKNVSTSSVSISKN